MDGLGVTGDNSPRSPRKALRDSNVKAVLGTLSKSKCRLAVLLALVMFRDLEAPFVKAWPVALPPLSYKRGTVVKNKSTLTINIKISNHTLGCPKKP